jgi:hypothetical protein
MREGATSLKRLIRDGCGLVACLLALTALSREPAAQDEAAPADPAGVEAEATDTLVVDDETMSLVASIAL